MPGTDVQFVIRVYSLSPLLKLKGRAESKLRAWTAGVTSISIRVLSGSVCVADYIYVTA